MSWLKEARALLAAKQEIERERETQEEARREKARLEKTRAQRAERKKALQRVRRANQLLSDYNCEDLLRDIQREIWNGGQITRKMGQVTEEGHLSSEPEVSLHFNYPVFVRGKRYTEYGAIGMWWTTGRTVLSIKATVAEDGKEWLTVSSYPDRSNFYLKDKKLLSKKIDITENPQEAKDNLRQTLLEDCKIRIEKGMLPPKK
jgi:multidrug efflux pump subunit AcrA (membrane-fusion protein)